MLERWRTIREHSISYLQQGHGRSIDHSQGGIRWDAWNLYIQKQTTELSAGDCRKLKQSCAHARDVGRPLNTHVTFAPYHNLKPLPVARSKALNRLVTYLRTWMRRRTDEPLVALWVWHSDETGRSPHVHVFMHCPRRLRVELNRALTANYPAGVIDVREGNDFRKLHPSGYWGSTLDYLMRFKSQQAWFAESTCDENGRRRGKTHRASKRENGRRRGTRSPIIGKRWGCTRNIASRAINADWWLRCKGGAAAIRATQEDA